MHSPAFMSHPCHTYPLGFTPLSLLMPQSGSGRPSPKAHLSPLTSSVFTTPRNMKCCMHTALAARAQPHCALPATAVQNKSPLAIFIQPMEQPEACKVVQPFTPCTEIAPPPRDINDTHTTMYSKVFTPEFVKSDKGQWVFLLNIPIPQGIPHPILKSLEYTVKYGTGNDHDIVISGPDSPDIFCGAVPDFPTKCNYRVGVGLPQMFGDVPDIYLSSVPAVKEDCYDNCLNRQNILPRAHMVKASHMCMRVHVDETVPAFMLGSLVVDVSATWVEYMQLGLQAECRCVEAKERAWQRVDAKRQSRVAIKCQIYPL